MRLGCLVTGGESDMAAFRGGLGASAALRLAGVGGGAIAPGPGRASTEVGTHTEGVGLSSEVGDGSKPLTKLAGRNDAARSAVLCVRLCKLTSLRFRDSATASIAVSEGVRGTSAPSREGGEELGEAGRDLRVRGRADMAKFEGNRRCKAGVGAGGSVLPDGAANVGLGAGAGEEFARERAGETSELVRRDRNLAEFSSSVVEKVGEVGAEACRDALLRPSGALEPREPRGGLTGAVAAGTSLKLRAFPKGGISGIRCKSAIMRCSELPLMTCSGLPSRENPRRARAGRATRLDALSPPPQVDSGEVGAVAAAAAGTEVVRGRACTLDCGDTDDEPVVAALRASVGLPALACPSPVASPSASSPLFTLDSLSDVSSHSGSLHSSGTAACACPFCFGAASSRSGSRRPESNHNLHERFSSRRPFCRLSLHRVKTAGDKDNVSVVCPCVYHSCATDRTRALRDRPGRFGRWWQASLARARARGSAEWRASRA